MISIKGTYNNFLTLHLFWTFRWFAILHYYKSKSVNAFKILDTYCQAAFPEDCSNLQCFQSQPIAIAGFLVFYFSLCTRVFQVITSIYCFPRELFSSPICLVPSGESSFKEQNFLWALPARQNIPDLKLLIKNKRREDYYTAAWPRLYMEHCTVRQLAAMLQLVPGLCTSAAGTGTEAAGPGGKPHRGGLPCFQIWGETMNQNGSGVISERQAAPTPLPIIQFSKIATQKQERKGW